MDASLRVAVERLYSKLRNTLALIDGMHRVRLGPPGCIGEKPEEIGPAFWREFDTCGNSFASLCKTLGVAHDESKAIVQTEAVTSIVFQTVARQSLAFKPAKATTFCGEAIERLRSLMLFYHRLLNRINFATRSNSDMLRLYHESESLWDEFGFSEGDFDELQRGLAWELATIFEMQHWNSVAPSYPPPPPPPPIPPQYQDLWEYATKKWARGSDFCKICESVSKGPGNYTDCVNSLLPNTNRSAQTTRFHSVVGKMNKILSVELQLGVYRVPRSEQVLVQRVNRGTRKKSSTKRKR